MSGSHESSEILSDWQRAVREDPKLATAICHDPDSPLTEFRCGNTNLHLAAQHLWLPVDNVAIAAILLAAGAAPNAQNESGYTPLHYAAGLNDRDRDMVELLLHYGADPNILNSQGQTALDLAWGHAGDGEAIRTLLIARGAKRGAGSHAGPGITRRAEPGAAADGPRL